MGSSSCVHSMTTILVPVLDHFSSTGISHPIRNALANRNPLPFSGDANTFVDKRVVYDKATTRPTRASEVGIIPCGTASGHVSCENGCVTLGPANGSWLLSGMWKGRHKDDHRSSIFLTCEMAEPEAEHSLNQWRTEVPDLGGGARV